MRIEKSKSARQISPRKKGFGDGNIIFKYGAGRVTAIYTNPGLDSNYERLFREAFTSLQKDSQQVDKGIAVIIFGVFYLEAISNQLFREMLFSQIKPVALAEAIWESTRRLDIRMKVNVISHNLGRQEKDDNLKSLQSLIDLRNRLAHFKEDDIPVSYSIPSVLSTRSSDEASINKQFGEALKKVFKNTPEPVLITQLKGQQCLKSARNIIKLEKWIQKIFRPWIGVKKVTRLSGRAKGTKLGRQRRKSALVGK